MILPSWNEPFSPLPLDLCLCKTPHQEKVMPFFSFPFSSSRVGSPRGSPTIREEVWPGGPRPEGVCTVLGMHCNSFLNCFWGQLLILCLLLDLLPLHRTLMWCTSRPHVGLCNLAECGFRLGLLIMSLRLGQVGAVSLSQTCRCHCTPCNVMNSTPTSASPPGGYFLEYHEHLSSSLFCGSCTTSC